MVLVGRFIHAWSMLQLAAVLQMSLGKTLNGLIFSAVKQGLCMVHIHNTGLLVHNIEVLAQ